ncbi:hypothetical protein NO559_08415 [Dasania sp. GY-MA-18]|uniref:Uncharacterized protein n=1 Tax=Dasania phycosphaerae TaxID=2950436 RepID=A0A9J6RMK9_9GAMM|nr:MULTISPECIES: hypothetical protein [Dasania]MCR8922791.1 hypothetical protein [Dasania sp. GY-MA-18]MCZ0865221.1 hypothetical protein [Dasania phycosphaerae]MCZ0868947.1 hypothetical protein [Dasania phycosphaerae]
MLMGQALLGLIRHPWGFSFFIFVNLFLSAFSALLGGFIFFVCPQIAPQFGRPLGRPQGEKMQKHI